MDDRLLGLTNAYDVMGLAPDATAEDVDAEFDLLVNRKGYRIGTRRSKWRQRLGEIKAAYATLADPTKRQAYDRSLGLAADGPLWARAASDAFTDSLVRPAADPSPRKTAADRPTGTAEEPEEAAGTHEAQARTPKRPPTHDYSAYVDYRSAAHQGSIRTWGIAAAVTLALGTVLYGSWHSKVSAPDAIDRTEASAAPRQTNVAPAQLASSPAANTVTDSGSELTPEEQAAAAADNSLAVASLRDWVGPAGETSNTVQATSLTAGAQAGVPTVGTSGAPSVAPPPIATSPAIAPPSPTQARAQPVPVHLSSPPIISGSPIVAAPRVAASRPVNVHPLVDVSRPAKFLGGGPTDADNRHGNYRGSLVVQFDIGREGRAGNCAVVRTSGNAKLDALTCKIVEERARFAPAYDARGQAIASQANATYTWGRGSRSKK